MGCGCFISTAYWKYSVFLSFSLWRVPRLTCFIRYLFGISRNTISILCWDTVKRSGSQCGEKRIEGRQAVVGKHCLAGLLFCDGRNVF